MWNKIKNVICHPSVIGLYVLDRFSHVFLFFFTIFVVTTSLLSIKDLNTEMFTQDVSNKISYSIMRDKNLDTTEFVNKQLNGNKTTIEFEDAIIIVNESAYINDTNKLVVVFSVSEANVYFAGFHLGNLKYKETTVKDFTIKKIGEGSFDDKINLQILVSSLLNTSEMNYRSLYFWHDFLDMLLVLVFTLCLSYLTASIANKMIVPKIRFKLCMYDTISYFVMTIFSILFNVYWVKYLGIAVCFIYTIITFSHIKIVAYRKDA